MPFRGEVLGAAGGSSSTAAALSWSPVDAAAAIRISAGAANNFGVARWFAPKVSRLYTGVKMIWDITRGTQTIRVGIWNPRSTRVASKDVVLTASDLITTITFAQPFVVAPADLYKRWAVSFLILSESHWYAAATQNGLTPGPTGASFPAGEIDWGNQFVYGNGDAYPDNVVANLIAPVEPVFTTFTGANTRAATRRLPILGQSNAVGEGTNLQTFTTDPALPCPGMMSGDYLQTPLQDPVGSLPVGWVDDVNFNTPPSPTGGGSVWPLVAQAWITAGSQVLDFVPCAKGSSRIATWAPGLNLQDRTTLFGAAMYRTLQAGGGHGILWWLGEGDIVDGTAPAAFAAQLVVIADAAFSVLGCKLYPATIAAWFSGAHNAARLALNTAIRALWGVGNIGTGPELAGLTYDDDAPHFTTDAGLAAAATIWWNEVVSVI